MLRPGVSLVGGMSRSRVVGETVLLCVSGPSSVSWAPGGGLKVMGQQFHGVPCLIDSDLVASVGT
jgi:hypothetical protein